jgi:hypothetical protein
MLVLTYVECVNVVLPPTEIQMYFSLSRTFIIHKCINQKIKNRKLQYELSVLSICPLFPNARHTHVEA